MSKTITERSGRDNNIRWLWCPNSSYAFQESFPISFRPNNNYTICCFFNIYLPFTRQRRQCRTRLIAHPTRLKANLPMEQFQLDLCTFALACYCTFLNSRIFLAMRVPDTTDSSSKQGNILSQIAPVVCVQDVPVYF